MSRSQCEADQANDDLIADCIYAINQREEQQLQAELEGGDDDDGDEEDMHGSHPINV